MSKWKSAGNLRQGDAIMVDGRSHQVEKVAPVDRVQVNIEGGRFIVVNPATVFEVQDR